MIMAINMELGERSFSGLNCLEEEMIRTSWTIDLESLLEWCLRPRRRQSIDQNQRGDHPGSHPQNNHCCSIGLYQLAR